MVYILLKLGPIAWVAPFVISKSKERIVMLVPHTMWAVTNLHQSTCCIRTVHISKLGWFRSGLTMHLHWWFHKRLSRKFCTILAFDFLVQPQSCKPYNHVGLHICFYNSSLLCIFSWEPLPNNQYIFIFFLYEFSILT